MQPRRTPAAHSPSLITPNTLALVLAYVHRHAPPRLRQRRFVAVVHLRTMAAWIGLPDPDLRTLRAHKLLAAHVALLQAAGLLSPAGSPVTLQPDALPWLFAAPEERIDRLLAALSGCAWPDALAALGLEEALSLDYTAYLRQTLQRQREENEPIAPPYARWLDGGEEGVWRLELAPLLPPYFLFDLLQLGDWAPADRILTCTPLTVATAAQRGIRRPYVRSLLEEVTNRELAPVRQQQLAQWVGRAHTYRVQTVHLFSTAQNEQLAAVLRRRRLRADIIEQIAPRHALITTAGIPRMQRWLATQGYPLDVETVRDRKEKEASPDLAYQWLGVRLLTELGDLIPLPYAPPHAHLRALSARLDPEQRSELDALCREIVDRLRRAIRGRDAFFPARQCPTPGLRQQIEAAIREEELLDIRYQALGEETPRRRRIQPLRLEQQGDLYYLTAYCTLAEANRTFRLDRVYGCEDVMRNA